MQDLTILMLSASLALGAAGFLARKPDSRVFSLASVVSVLAIASALLDDTIPSGSAQLLISAVAPLAVLIYSAAAMILEGGRKRWR